MASKHYTGYRARWTDENGERQSATFPEKASAKLQERLKKAEVAEIKHGLRTPAAPKKTFEELCAYWVRYKVPRKRSGRDDASIIRNHLLPSFAARGLTELGEQDFDGYLAERGHLSEKTLYTLRALIRLGRTFYP